MPAEAHDELNTLDDLADLGELASKLNALGISAMLTTPPSGLPYLDVAVPALPAPGEKVYAQAGSYFWAAARPIGPASQPSQAAQAITRTLNTTAP